MFQNINFEPDYSISQGNIQYIWIWNISQAPLYFLNQNIIDLIMGKLVYLVGMITEWRDIPWECT